MSRVVLAGGSGFLGRPLTDVFKSAGHEVVILARHPKPTDGVRVVAWDAKNQGDWSRELDGALAVINLAGEPIGQRWTDEAKKRIIDSRVDSVKAVAEAIGAAKDKPAVWVNASAIGYYGNTGDREVDETSAPGTGFMAETCVLWEKAVEGHSTAGTRQVRLRIGVVLGKGGGALAPLLKLTKAFAGGSAGSGKQFMPWIHVEDLARMFAWCVSNPEIEGPVNGVAPLAVRNSEFMAALRKAVGRPWSPPAPAFAIKFGAKAMGVEPEMILDGSRVVPRVGQEKRFVWEHADLERALRDLVK